MASYIQSETVVGDHTVGRREQSSSVLGICVRDNPTSDSLCITILICYCLSSWVFLLWCSVKVISPPVLCYLVSICSVSVIVSTWCVLCFSVVSVGLMSCFVLVSAGIIFALSAKC